MREGTSETEKKKKKKKKSIGLQELGKEKEGKGHVKVQHAQKSSVTQHVGAHLKVVVKGTCKGTLEITFQITFQGTLHSKMHVKQHSYVNFKSETRGGGPFHAGRTWQSVPQ
jgi:hypothetical protein